MMPLNQLATYGCMNKRSHATGLFRIQSSISLVFQPTERVSGPPSLTAGGKSPERMRLHRVDRLSPVHFNTADIRSISR